MSRVDGARAGGHGPSVPRHLAQYATAQQWSSYGAEEHETWSALYFEVSRRLAGCVPEELFDGLHALGVSGDGIPDLELLNRRLQPHRWRVVPVDGMLPSDVYVDFLGNRLLPAVPHIRSRFNLGYTPTPDIFHDLFGHVPLLTVPAYADILHRWGRLCAETAALEADPAFPYVKLLSEAKVNASANREQIAALEQQLQALSRGAAGPPPGRSGLSRRLAGFGWWTIEYGVLRSSGGTKCYGAAIFSSLSEASRFRAGGYRLQALTASALDLPYDATAEQSQLFIADGLEHVAELLDQLEAEACAADAGEPVERRDPPAADCAE